MSFSKLRLVQELIQRNQLLVRGLHVSILIADAIASIVTECVDVEVFGGGKM